LRVSRTAPLRRFSPTPFSYPSPGFRLSPPLKGPTPLRNLLAFRSAFRYLNAAFPQYHSSYLTPSVSFFSGNGQFFFCPKSGDASFSLISLKGSDERDISFSCPLPLCPEACCPASKKKWWEPFCAPGRVFNRSFSGHPHEGVPPYSFLLGPWVRNGITFPILRAKYLPSCKGLRPGFLVRPAGSSSFLTHF